MGLGKTRTAIVAAREEQPDGPFLVICPASVKLNWRREIQLVEPGADVQVVAGGNVPFEPGHRWTVVNYDLVSRHREALGGGRLGGDHRRRGALHQERLGALPAHARAARRRRQAAVRRTRRRLPADRHADGQPAPRPVQPAQGRAPPAGHELLPATPSATARRSTTATASTPTAPRTSTSWPRSSSGRDAAAHQVRGPRPAREGALVGARRRARSTRVRGAEQRALDYLAEHPARSGPTWVTFLGMLNRARHALAVAKATATADFVTDCVDNGQKVVVFTLVHRRRRHAARTLRRRLRHPHRRRQHATARDRAVERFQTDDDVRVFVGNLHAAGVGITLTAGTHVVFNDLDWVPANHWQAEDRIHRIGQTATDVRHLPPRRRHARRLRRRPARAEGRHDRHPRGRRPATRRRSSTPSSPAPSTARRPTASRTDAADAAAPDDGTARRDARPARAVPRRAARPPTPARRSSSSRAPASPASCTRCASPTASPCATAPASPTGATASTAAR